MLAGLAAVLLVMNYLRTASDHDQGGLQEFFNPQRHAKIITTSNSAVAGRSKDR